MRADGLERLARGLYPSTYKTRNPVFAVLTAYFDKSSDHPPGITSVAGYVAPLAEWARVEQRWHYSIEYWSRLDRFAALGGFHMSRLRDAIGEEKADLCIKHFRGIIEQSNLKAVGAAVLDQDWYKSDWGDDVTKKLQTPYEQCLDAALRLIGEHAHQCAVPDGIDVICCLDEKLHRMQEIFDIKKSQFPLLGGLATGTSARFRMLECADLGAGCLRQSWKSIVEDPSASAIPWGELPTGRGTRKKTAFWSLRQGAVLSRALTLHIARSKAERH